MPWRDVPRKKAAGDARIFAVRPLADPQEVLAQLAREGPRPFYALLAESRPRPPLGMVWDTCQVLEAKGQVWTVSVRYTKRLTILGLDIDGPEDVQYTPISRVLDALELRQAEVGPALRGVYMPRRLLTKAARLWALLYDYPGQNESQLMQMCQYFRQSRFDMEVDRECLTTLDTIYQDTSGRWYAKVDG